MNIASASLVLALRTGAQAPLPVEISTSWSVSPHDGGRTWTCQAGAESRSTPLLTGIPTPRHQPYGPDLESAAQSAAQIPDSELRVASLDLLQALANALTSFEAPTDTTLLAGRGEDDTTFSITLASADRRVTFIVDRIRGQASWHSISRQSAGGYQAFGALYSGVSLHQILSMSLPARTGPMRTAGQPQFFVGSARQNG